MDRTDYGYNLEYRAQIRARLAALASALLSGEAGVIETARKLSEFVELEDEFWPAIRVFVSIDSETDALPIGEVRQYWNADALAGKDVEIALAERQWREAAVDASKELLKLLQAHP